MFAAVVPFAQELNITVPLICYQGGLVRHPVTEETTFHLPVPADLAQEVVTLARKRGIQVNAFADDRLHVESLTPEAEVYMRIARVEATIVPDLIAFLQDNPSTKLVLVNLDESKTNSLVEELTDHFGSRLGITKSHPYYTEAIHPGRIQGACAYAACQRARYFTRPDSRHRRQSERPEPRRDCRFRRSDGERRSARKGGGRLCNCHL